jgi:hypothetical protein
VGKPVAFALPYWKPTAVSLVVLGVLIVAFATLVTAHVTLAIGIARREPRWRGLVALVVVPLAPWWGWHERMRARGVVWIVAAVVYGVSLGLSFSG